MSVIFSFLFLLCSHPVQIIMSIYRHTSLLLKFLHMYDHDDKLVCHLHVLEHTFNIQWCQWFLYYVHTCTISLCIEG